MFRLENNGRYRRPAGIENPTGRTDAPVYRPTLEVATSSRQLNIEHSMEIDKPDTVALLYGDILRGFAQTRTANASSPVYGSTFGNAPLATPSTESEEKLSMDQYPSYERSSYMSLLKQQQLGHEGVPKHGKAAYKSYETANQRKASFTARWPHPTLEHDVDKMVKYGFFYTGDGDLIKCFYCGIGLKDWSPADDPLAEHVRYAPDCQFLVDTIPPTRLATIKASRLPNTIVSTRESVSIGGAEQATPSVSGAKLNNDIVLPVQPRSPQYRFLSVRISSFSKWPQDIIQKPEELAEAGFFYTGCGDRVRCYVCDGGLQKWSPEDNAWVEHARWFHNCAYVIKVKGQDFVDLVRLSVEHQRLEEEGAHYIGESGQDVRSNELSENINWKYEQKAAKEDVEMTIKSEPQTEEELETETELLRSVVKCLMCEENDANCLYLPCAHHRLCVECSTNISLCPICQRKIHNKVKTFMS